MWNNLITIETLADDEEDKADSNPNKYNKQDWDANRKYLNESMKELNSIVENDINKFKAAEFATLISNVEKSLRKYDNFKNDDLRDDVNEHKEEKEHKSNPKPKPKPKAKPKASSTVPKAGNQSSDDDDDVPTDDESSQKGGLMDNPEDALDTRGIDKIMNHLNKNNEFLGTFPKDHFYKAIANIKPNSRGGAILNLDESSKPGTHWVGVFYDGRPKGSHTVEYFDSFGRKPPHDINEDLKRIPHKLNSDQPLKFKTNGLVKQHKDSVSCGYQAMNFLLNRYRGKPFKSATGFNSIKKNEDHMEKLQDRFEFML